MDVQDALNHSLGQYIIYSFNKPDKYPKTPFRSKDRHGSGGMTSDSALDAYIKAMAKKEEK